MVMFRQFNLLDSYGWLDDLDLVLCRNVMIYFDAATKASVLERIADTMAPGGVLALGEAESARTLSSLYRELPGDDGLYARLKTPAPRVGLLSRRRTPSFSGLLLDSQTHSTQG